jgi:hypothetical protein
MLRLNRWWWALGIGAWVALSLVVLGVVLLIGWYQQSANYPGSIYMGESTMYRFNPLLYIRQDASYRSSDPFNEVFNWYSSGFELGPETFAQSGCALMARSFTDLAVIERQMSVMVCDTPNGRLIFVMRSLSFRVR